MQPITAELKNELVAYVLNKTDIWLFNIAVQEFSTQRLYARFKRDLMSDYKELMPGDLNYSIAMAEAFREFECNTGLCRDLKHKIDKLKYAVKLWKRTNPEKYVQAVEEHNKLVEEYSAAIAPQNKLIALYKKVIKARKK